MLLSVDLSPSLFSTGMEETLQMMKEAGFDGIDFDIEPAHLGDNYLEIAKEIKALLDRIGLVCTQAHAPHNFVFGTKMDFSNIEYRDTFRSIEFAKVLGTKYCVIHGSPVPDGPLSGQFMEHNFIYYKSFEEEAKRCDMYIGVENLKFGILPRPEYVNKMLGMLKSPVYYPHVDLGHSALVGVEPDVFLQKLNCGPVRAIHVHDYNVQTDHMLPFLGRSNWDRIVKALVDIGYEGTLSMEIFQTQKLVSAYSADILPAMYCLAAEIGRELIRRIEVERGKRV